MNFDFPTFLVGLTALTGGIWLFDALFFAGRRKSEGNSSDADAVATASEAPKEPVIVEYARSFFPVILAVLVLRSFIVEPFKIPSGSMMPTLVVGDFILVNKFSYGIRLPVSNAKILDLGEPERGDVVVFRWPQDPSIDFIKRFVGLPGDRIAYGRDKTLYINGVAQPQHLLGYYEGDPAGREKGIELRSEDLEGVEHDILVNPRVPPFSPSCRVLMYGEITVPPGHYFAIGDNRDNSNDSRCWEFVPEENLVGKAFMIWMNYDGQKEGFPVSWGRIGTTID